MNKRKRMKNDDGNKFLASDIKKKTSHVLVAFRIYDSLGSGRGVG